MRSTSGAPSSGRHTSAPEALQCQTEPVIRGHDGLTIAGLDKFDNETIGTSKSNVTVEARDILLKPRFDARACNPTCAGNPNWETANNGRYYVFNNGNG